MPSVSTEQTPVQPSTPSVPPVQTSGIGSKVSFVASDGKTYTGTIKDIQGDQYKIKYDAFEFETWLSKNQFTMITGNVAPPVYTAVPNAQVTFSSTTASPGGGTPLFITHPGFWGSLMIIVGFFTNWLNGAYDTGSEVFSGFTVVKYASEIIDTGNELLIGFLIVVVIIVLSAVICLLYVIGVGIAKGAFRFLKILPLLAIIGFIVYVVIKAQNSGADYETEKVSAWKILGIGIYLTLIGSVLLAISRSRK